MVVEAEAAASGPVVKTLVLELDEEPAGKPPTVRKPEPEVMVKQEPVREQEPDAASVHSTDASFRSRFESVSAWLNDEALGAAQELEVGEQHNVKLIYPAHMELVLENIARHSKVQRAATGVPETGSLITSFCRDMHWYTIIFSFDAKTIYYFEAYGGPLRGKHALVLMFEKDLKQYGWKLSNLSVQLQTDSVSCGVWAFVLTRAWCAYQGLGSSSTAAKEEEWFRAYFISWLSGQTVYDLKTLGPGKRRQWPERANIKYIHGVREELRQRMEHYVPTWMQPDSNGS